MGIHEAATLSKAKVKSFAETHLYYKNVPTKERGIQNCSPKIQMSFRWFCPRAKGKAGFIWLNHARHLSWEHPTLQRTPRASMGCIVHLRILGRPLDRQGFLRTLEAAKESLRPSWKLECFLRLPGTSQALTRRVWRAPLPGVPTWIAFNFEFRHRLSFEFKFQFNSK